MAEIPTAQDIFDYLEGYCGISTVKVIHSETFTALASTDIITISGNYRIATGTMIKFVTSGLLPSPIVTNDTYYAIYISDTEIQVALTYQDSINGIAINLLTDGNGIIQVLDFYYVSRDWVEKRIAQTVIPNIEKIIRSPLDEEEQITELHNGEGSTVLFLDRKNIKQLDNIQIITNNFSNTYVSINNIELEPDQGILKAKHNFEEVYGLYPIFPRGKKNIKITYTLKRPLDDVQICEAIILLTVDLVLGFIGGRTGGGDSLSLQSYSRSFGDRGKWTDTRREVVRQAYGLLRPYITGVVGS